MKVTVALAQINTRLGNVPANLEKHLAYLRQARQSGADLVVFPELSLSGYLLQDLALEVALFPSARDPLFSTLLQASREIDVVVGFVERDRRQRVYVAGAYLASGEVVHVHRKVYLPTYSLFDEGRYFAAGEAVRAFDTRFGRMGLLICEDFWHISPPYLLWLDGAELLLLTSASPGRGLGQQAQFESSRWVELITRAYASVFTVFVAHANRAGFEDGLNFWGGSAAFDPNGRLLAQGPYHEEALVLAELDLNQVRRTRARLPLLRDERPTLLLKELHRILGSMPGVETTLQADEALLERCQE